MNNIVIINGTYDWKLRLKLGGKRFLKGFSASLLIAVIQFSAEFIQNNPAVFPQKYTLYTGLIVAILLGLEKALQKEKK
jgi:hypothetical protein